MSLAGTMLFDGRGRPLRVAEAPRRGRRTFIVASGAPIFAGQFQWDDPPELRDPERRHETFRKMATTDAYVAEVLRDNALPLLARAVWDIAPGVEPKPKPGMLRKAQPPQLQPGLLPGQRPPLPPRKASLEGEEEDLRTPEEKQHAEIAELVGANLFRHEGDVYGRRFWSSTPWSQRLREILKFLDHGFALFHKRAKVVDGKRVYDRLLWLEPGTVVRWVFDADGVLQGIERRYRRPDGEPVSREEIGADELALYVWDMVGMRVEGTALIRPMFGAWKRKEFLLRCKMIAAQRAGVGQPWAKRDPSQDGTVEGDDVADRIEKFLQSSFGSGIEHQYLSAENPSLEMGYLKQDALDLRKFDQMTADENLSIAHGGGTKSGMLGEMPGGSRAVGEVQQVDKYVLVEAIAQIIGEQEQGGICGVRGLIEELIGWNFGELDKYPYVRVSNIDPNEPTRNIPLLKDAVDAGIVKARPQLEKMVLDRLGFELPDEAFQEEPVDSNAPPGDDPSDLPPDPEGAAMGRRLRLRVALESILTRTSWRMTPDEARRSGLSRQPTEFEEQILAFGSIRAAQQEGDEQMASLAKRADRKMIEDIVARGRAGKIAKDTLGNLPKSKPKGESEYLRSIRDQFVAIANVGRRHVEEELERQKQLAARIRGGQSAFEPSEKPEIDKPGGTIPKGAPLLPAGAAVELPKFLRDVVDPVQVLYSELAREARATAQVTVDGIWNRLVREAIGEYQRLFREGVEGPQLWDRIEAHLHGLSDKPLDLLGREAATVAYDEGRDLGIMEAAIEGQVAYATRTAIMDGWTCENCVELDQTSYEVGSEDYYAFMPPARCKGGERCRCSMYGLHEDLLKAVNDKRRARPDLYPQLPQ